MNHLNLRKLHLILLFSLTVVRAVTVGHVGDTEQRVPASTFCSRTAWGLRPGGLVRLLVSLASDFPSETLHLIISYFPLFVQMIDC